MISWDAKIWTWKGWPIVKWPVGVIILWIVLFLVWKLETDKNYDKEVCNNLLGFFQYIGIYIRSFFSLLFNHPSP